VPLFQKNLKASLKWEVFLPYSVSALTIMVITENSNEEKSVPADCLTVLLATYREMQRLWLALEGWPASLCERRLTSLCVQSSGLRNTIMLQCVCVGEYPRLWYGISCRSTWVGCEQHCLWRPSALLLWRPSRPSVGMAMTEVPFLHTVTILMFKLYWPLLPVQVSSEKWNEAEAMTIQW